MFFIGLGIGIVLGGGVYALVMRKLYGRYKATLYVDRNNPEKDLYKLDAGDIESLAKKKKARYVVSVQEANLQRDFHVAN